MKVVPLAADSLGVRSMATYVEAEGLRLLIDPGATVSQRRYGLDPAPEETEALARARDRIDAYAVRATVVTVSHYHADHWSAEPLLYAGRRVLAKDPRRMIDARQAVAGRGFWSRTAGHGRVEPLEGSVMEIEGALLRGSPPLPHGPEGSAFGYVVALTVDAGRRFVHAADLQGPVSPVATAYLIREHPDLLYVSGPATYLTAQTGETVVERGVANLLRIVNETGCRVLLDHHATRDRRYRERLGRLFETGRVMTAAEYLGLRDQCLEADRPLLWARHRRAGRIADRSGGTAAKGERLPWLTHRR